MKGARQGKVPSPIVDDTCTHAARSTQRAQRSRSIQLRGAAYLVAAFVQIHFACNRQPAFDAARGKQARTPLNSARDCQRRPRGPRGTPDNPPAGQVLRGNTPRPPAAAAPPFAARSSSAAKAERERARARVRGGTHRLFPPDRKALATMAAFSEVLITTVHSSAKEPLAGSAILVL